MLQVLQTALFVRKEAASLREEALRAKECEQAALVNVDRARGDLRKVKKENEGLKSATGQAKRELALAREELAQLSEEKRQIQVECTRLKKACADGAVYFAMETKVKLLEDHAAGMLGQYSLEEEREALADFRNANPGIGEFSESDSDVGGAEGGGDAESRLAEGDGVGAESDAPGAHPVDGDMPDGEGMVGGKSAQL